MKQRLFPKMALPLQRSITNARSKSAITWQSARAINT